MKVNYKVLSLAVAGVFALGSAVALAHGPGFGGGMGGFGPMSGFGHMGGYGPMQGDATVVQQRVDQLGAALELQPDQRAAWAAYESKVKSEAQARAKFHEDMQSRWGDPLAMSEFRDTMFRHNSEAALEIGKLRDGLLAVLTPEQKATFGQYGGGPRFAGGAGSDATPGYGTGTGRGYGPGMGRGYGRGCIGA